MSYEYFCTGSSRWLMLFRQTDRHYRRLLNSFQYGAASKILLNAYGHNVADGGSRDAGISRSPVL